MQILHLIKKDILLSGNYMLVSIIVVFIMPIFLGNQENVHLSSIYILLMSNSFSCYFLFSNIFMLEDKYKGSLYLMAIPYKRRNIVMVKYIMALTMFGLQVGCYIFLSRFCFKSILPIKPNLNLSSIAIAFLVMSAVLSTFFVLYFRYSYTKIKGALLIVMIFLPTWGMVLATYLFGENFITGLITLTMKMSIMSILIGITLLVLSAKLSVKFMEHKED